MRWHFRADELFDAETWTVYEDDKVIEANVSLPFAQAIVKKHNDEERVREEACENCRFWSRGLDRPEHMLDAQGWGACRRNPPIAIQRETFEHLVDNPDDAGSANVGLWPHTEYDGWCGEFKRRPLPEAAP